MKIKRYMVNNMNEAMNMIRYELGREAVIISQRKIRKPGFLGFFMKKQLEVTAAIDNTKKQEEPGVEKVKPQFQSQFQPQPQQQTQFQQPQQPQFQQPQQDRKSVV
jgi:flagellar biosynthesis protein FlhF